jgi:hypothetical protein
MDHMEIAFTPTGVVRRRVSEEVVTEEAADLIFNQIARDITVFTPNLVDAGEYFSALHGVSNQNGSSWFAAKVLRLQFNGSWVAEAARMFPGRDGLVTFADASELAVEVPIPLFVFIAPQEKHLFLLTFKVTELSGGGLRKTWARLPFPNCFNDGALCTGELPVYDQSVSVTTNALRMLAAWVDNPWNADLYSPDTPNFLAKVASFMLPGGEPIPADESDWSRYASAVNPGVAVINAAFEPLFALYGTEAGKEAGDGTRV